MLPYTNNLEHIYDELRRLDLLLERAVLQFRSHYQDKPAEFRGLYISETEIDELIKTTNNNFGDWDDLESKACALHKEIQRRVIATRVAGVALRLAKLRKIFDLTYFETNLLLLALAPELNLRYQKLYAYLQDDVTRKYPTVDLALKLFCKTPKEQVEAREAFAETAPLFVNTLLSLHQEQSERGVSLLSHFLKIESRVAEFVLGSDCPEQRLINPLRTIYWLTPKSELGNLVLPQGATATLEKLILLGKVNVPWVCLLHGSAGAGKKSAAATVCQTWNKPLLVLNLPSMLQSDVPFQTLLRLAFREARLYDAKLYLDGWHELVEEPRYLAARSIVEQEISQIRGLIFFGSESFWQPLGAHQYKFISLELPLPDESVRQQIWKTYLQEKVTDESNLNYLASAFRFSGGQIRSSIADAESHALLNQGENYQLTMADLLLGCHTNSNQHLSNLARKIKPQRIWQDLVLPKDTLAQLQEFCHMVRYRVKVYADWGFNQKLSLGKGAIALFSGDSGTGKTLSAEIIAKELGLELYKIDLSCVVSKYIGETEKNLNRVFQEAQQSNAILFFDEADALFGKRSEVKDAHDRYANIEINYLLQRVEEYEGAIILASNMSKSIDAAFVRRMHFCIEFPFPDEDYRLQIWRGIFPPQAPLAGDVDFEFLARNFKITGGNIKNIAVAAAFRAAEEGSSIYMKHLILSLKREYQKLGKVCEQSEFAQYYQLVN